MVELSSKRDLGSEKRDAGAWSLVPAPSTQAIRLSLLAQLKSHLPADAAEARSLREILEFLRVCPKPFSRATLSGHVTGSAIVVHPVGPEFLLVKHRKLDRWLQPGGHVQEQDESVLATAMRETAEETGHAARLAPWCNRILHVDVHKIPARLEEPEHLHYDIRYLLTAARDAPHIAEEEVLEAKWLAGAGLDNLDLDASVMSAIAAARSTLVATEG